MKTDKQIKGINGNLIVHGIINDYWKSDYQKIDQDNDDGIDGIIHVRRHGELTGEVIYVQIKSGDGYKSITKKRPEYIGINVGADYINEHKQRWNRLVGAVILIFVDDTKKAYWADLKDENSYSVENKSIILIPNKQRFGAHSKGHFRKIGNIFPNDNKLHTIKIERSDLSYLRIDEPLKQSARRFYIEWSHSKIGDRTNPSLGEIIINRSGWRHISRSSRGYDKIFQSWQLLSIARKMIQIVDKAYQITKHVSTFEDENQYILKDYISLRANIIILNRNKTVIQVILRRSRTVNKVNRETNQKIWFYSVYEPRRGV